MFWRFHGLISKYNPLLFMIVKLKKEERLLNAYCIEYMYCGIIFIRGIDLNPWPRNHAFPNFGRGVHRHHEHLVFSNIYESKEKEYLDGIYYYYIAILVPPYGKNHGPRGHEFLQFW